jgi:hypothetical protein
MNSFSERLTYAGMAVSENGYHVWGTSPILDDEGTIHLFVARWPVSAAFDPGWRRASEIALYTGKDPEGPFLFEEVVLKGTGGPGWDACAPHNPTVTKIGGRYFLLYIANDGQNQRPSQRIGMLVSDDPRGPWRKAGRDGLILSPPDETSIWCFGSCIGVTNPTLVEHPDGRYLLYFKAKLDDDLHRMGVAVAEDPEGPYIIQKDPVAKNEQMIEDGYAFVENGAIQLLTTDCKNGTGLLWPSQSGLSFGEPVPGFAHVSSYFDQDTMSRATCFRGKGELQRPQLLIQNSRPTHLYLASGMNTSGGDGSCSYVFRIDSDD